MGLFKFWILHENDKKNTSMINHIPMKQVWLKKNIILIKDV